jgi:hypothetical protein
MDFLKQVLPFIGAAATGGVPALIGMAAKTVGDILGAEIPQTAKDIAAAVAGATPEQLLQLKQADQQFELQMRQLGITERELYLKDTQSARASFSGSRPVFLLGIAILLIFAIALTVSTVGSYYILTAGIQIQDPGVVAAVFGFLGTTIGYIAAQAQQVVGFFFGSSSGSAQKTDQLAQAIQAIGKSKG